jgi:hypothetical protein
MRVWPPRVAPGTWGDAASVVRLNLAVLAEDIMTSRRHLRHALDDAEAARVSDKEEFDAIPIIDLNGLVREFWSRAIRGRVPIRNAHRISHDTSIEKLLPALGQHIVQFVYYRSEMVGLVDASDLNKPLARIVWLHPMLELERAILDASLARGISEAEQKMALGKAAKSAVNRREKAKRHDLVLPLLGYAQFQELLRASSALGLVELDNDDILELSRVRNRAAHSGDAIVEDREDCARIGQALTRARKAKSQVVARSSPGKRVAS